MRTGGTIFKNTTLGYVSFPGPFLETFFKTLHQLDLPGTSTEVDNLETIFKQRCLKIVTDTDGIGWGFHDEVSEYYYNFIGTE